MAQAAQNPDLEPLNALVGGWTTEATHPAYPSAVVPGRAAFEWLEGEQFLIERSQAEHADFPDALAVIGIPDDRLVMHYFDSRGVYRLYEMSLSDGGWRWWRDAPGFSQRFTGTFSQDGDTIAGVWEVSTDNSSWTNDLEIAYRRAT